MSDDKIKEEKYRNMLSSVLKKQREELEKLVTNTSYRIGKLCALSDILIGNNPKKSTYTLKQFALRKGVDQADINNFISGYNIMWETIDEDDFIVASFRDIWYTFKERGK